MNATILLKVLQDKENHYAKLMRESVLADQDRSYQIQYATRLALMNVREAVEEACK